MSFWEFVHEELQAGEPLMLLLVVASRGSSPGKPGFKMAVTLRGRTAGHHRRRRPWRKNSRTRRPRSSRAAAARAPAEAADSEEGTEKRSGAICSGWQQVALLPLAAGDSDAVDSLIFALKRNRPGRLQFSPRGMEFQPREKRAAAFSSRSAGDWIYREETGQRPILTIIGGGHVGLALSRVMAGLDFHVRVLDDREGLATMESNSFAQEKHVVSFRSVGRLVEEGSMSYVVIMTYGHQADEKVLGQLVSKKLRYLGLMGSPAKNASIFARLKKKGVSRRALGEGSRPGRAGHP